MHLIKRIGFLFGLLAISALSFQITTSWLDKVGTSQVALRSPAPVAPVGSGTKSDPGIVTGSTGSYCELSFPLDDCPAHPRGFNISSNNTLRDAWDGADKSQERCMRRAAEFHSYCAFTGTVTARFYTNGRLTSSSNAPGSNGQ